MRVRFPDGVYEGQHFIRILPPVRFDARRYVDGIGMNDTDPFRDVLRGEAAGEENGNVRVLPGVPDPVAFEKLPVERKPGAGPGVEEHRVRRRCKSLYGVIFLFDPECLHDRYSSDLLPECFDVAVILVPVELDHVDGTGAIRVADVRHRLVDENPDRPDVPRKEAVKMGSFRNGHGAPETLREDKTDEIRMGLVCGTDIHFPPHAAELDLRHAGTPFPRSS